MKPLDTSATPRRRNKFPSRYPIDVSKTVWFYEERGHIKVIAELKTKTMPGGAEQHLGTTHSAIPFRLLCRAVDRYRKFKAKRRGK